MKASTKLMSLLLLVAMCMSFMAIPARAADVDNSSFEGVITPEMMLALTASEPEPAEQSGTEATVQTAEQPAAQPVSQEQAKVYPVVITRGGAEYGYDSLLTALSNAANGDIVTLHSDFSFASTLTVDKSVTLQLNGHTLSIAVSAVNPGLTVTGATIRGGSIVITAKEVTVKEGEEAPVYTAGVTGSATLDKVHLTYVGPGRMMNAVATVYGGSYTSDPSVYLPEGYKAVLEEGRYVVVEVTEEEEETPAEEEPAEETPAEGQPAEEQPAEGQSAEGQSAEGQPAEEQPAEETPAEEQPAEEQPAEETPAEEQSAEEQPAEEQPGEEQPAEETPAEEQPGEEQPAEETPAEEQPAEEQPGEEQPVEETPAEEAAVVIEGAEENEPVAEEPVAEQPAEEKRGLVEQFLDLLNPEDPDVDQAAKEIPHSEEKYARDGDTEVTLGPAPDDVSVNVTSAANYEDAVQMASEEENEVNIVWAKDIDVTGELEQEVTVTIVDPVFATLPEGAVLYHIVDGVAQEVVYTLNREESSITFRTSSFSPYALTVPDVTDPATANDEAEITMNLGPDAHVKDGKLQPLVTAAASADFTLILDKDATWDITDWGSVTNLEVNLNKHTLNGAITVPSGKTLTISGADKVAQTVKGPFTVNGGTLILYTPKSGGTINAPCNITLSGGALYVDGSGIKQIGTIDASSNSFIQINNGTYGEIKSDGSDGGHVTGGTYNKMVPANVLASGYENKASGDKYTVVPNLGASVKAGSISFNRNSAAIEWHKGSSRASQNYPLTFVASPYDKLQSINYLKPDGSTTLDFVKGTNYTYNEDPASDKKGTTTFSKGFLTDLFDSVPAGRGYLQFNFAGGITIQVPMNVMPDVKRDRYAYVIDSYEDLTFPVTDDGSGNPDLPLIVTVDKLNELDNFYDKQIAEGADKQYTWVGNVFHLNAKYLNLLKPGEHTIEFWYDMGFAKQSMLRWTFYVTEDYKVVQINGVNMYKEGPMADVNWYQYSGKNLNFTANAISKLNGVKVDGKYIASGNYTVSRDTNNGTTVVGLYPGYLATLPQGKHSIDLVFEDGIASATFSVLGASASPKTGDNNHAGLWVGLLVLSGAAVVALIPKKKKAAKR